MGLLLLMLGIILVATIIFGAIDRIKQKSHSSNSGSGSGSDAFYFFDGGSSDFGDSGSDSGGDSGDGGD